MTQSADYDKMQRSVMTIVGQNFRPEFVNRIGDIIVFHALSREHVHGIARVQMPHLQERLESRDMKLHMGEEALEHLHKRVLIRFTVPVRFAERSSRNSKIRWQRKFLFG